MESHWRRFNRALEHIQAADKAIGRWLGSDAYRIVKEHDPKTRRTAYVARFGDLPTELPDLVGEAAHNMRSALDHLALALNTKGYAEANGGAELPAAEVASSSFPIYGNVSNKGQPMNGTDAFRSATSYRNMPQGAADLIEELQPYNRGEDFASDPLWIVHELNRIDKHRIDLAASASAPQQAISGSFPAIDEGKLGIGGPVYDGKELSWWVVSKGAEEPDADFRFTRGVAFGEGTPLSGQPVVRSLHEVRNFLRYKVAFPLDRFL
jgi:hypothetical protein